MKMLSASGDFAL